MNLICLMDHTLFQPFKVILNTLLKKHGTIANNPPGQVYINKIKNRIVFKIKADYKIELLSPETTKLLESTKKDDDQDKDGQDVPKLQSVEVVLVHCNLVNNNYQQASKVSFTRVPNKQFGQLIIIALYSLTVLNTTNAEFSSTEVWFTTQNGKQLEVDCYVKKEIFN